MTEDMLNPNICSSALDENGNLDREAYGDGAHVWHRGECSECGYLFSTENLFPAIVYYYQKDDERNAGVVMIEEATSEAAMRYMKAHEWDFDEDGIEVYPLNTIEDEAGNEYSVETSKK